MAGDRRIWHVISQCIWVASHSSTGTNMAWRRTSNFFRNYTVCSNVWYQTLQVAMYYGVQSPSCDLFAFSYASSLLVLNLPTSPTFLPTLPILPISPTFSPTLPISPILSVYNSYLAASLHVLISASYSWAPYLLSHLPIPILEPHFI